MHFAKTRVVPRAHNLTPPRTKVPPAYISICPARNPISTIAPSSTAPPMLANATNLCSDLAPYVFPCCLFRQCAIVTVTSRKLYANCRRKAWQFSDSEVRQKSARARCSLEEHFPKSIARKRRRLSNRWEWAITTPLIQRHGHGVATSVTQGGCRNLHDP
jgi:hypothetical protein